MALWAQIATLAAMIIATWSLGWLLPVFAFPIGFAALLLLWGLAPWWAVVPATAIGGALLYEAFGFDVWPVLMALGVSCLGAIPLGEWWREGRGPLRGLIAFPFLLLLPWLLWRLLLSYSSYPQAHLPWLPVGSLSLLLLWGAVLFVREYTPRRRSYSLSDTPLSWRGAG